LKLAKKHGQNKNELRNQILQLKASFHGWRKSFHSKSQDFQITGLTSRKVSAKDIQLHLRD